MDNTQQHYSIKKIIILKRYLQIVLGKVIIYDYLFIIYLTD